MVTDLGLVAELRARLASYDDVVEKRITGGTGFMWRGNLLCGVMGDELLVRLDKAVGADLVGEDTAHPMTMGGRGTTGWLLVPMPVPADERGPLLSRWLDRAKDYAQTLPAK
jgi:hypothetical protein